MKYSYWQVMKIRQNYEAKLKKYDPTFNNHSGIYIYHRIDDKDFKFAYVGQAEKLLNRLVSHFMEYDHIALSLKKRNLYDKENNPYGWKITWKEYPASQLNDMEQFYIKAMADKGYQLYNKTIGSQGEGKTGLNPNEAPKGYYDGVEHGYEKCRKEVAEMFDKYLKVEMKEPILNKNGTVNQLKAKKLEEFVSWLKVEKPKK